MPLVCCVTLENDFAPGILFTIKANGLVKYGLFFKAELDEIGYLYFIDFYIKKTEKNKCMVREVTLTTGGGD